MYKVLHPRDIIDHVCQEMKEKEDSPALGNTKMYQSLDDCIKKNK